MQATPLQIGMEPYPGYRLQRRLGVGGFGEVWQAGTPQNQAVALKFLPCTAPRATAQELRALQAVRQLSHPHLLRIDQVWCHLGYIVIAMELADGSLQDLLAVSQTEVGTPLDAAQVCYYLTQAALALDFLNTRQHVLGGRCVAVQHCDVKPSNLLLFGDQVKVADFGLSTSMTDRDRGRSKSGTLDYCAPEVFQGRLAEQTDQYALAVTYCLLRSGRLPFADTPNSFSGRYVRPAPDLSMLTTAEQPIVARALHHTPHQRWLCCSELIARLAKATSRK